MRRPFLLRLAVALLSVAMLLVGGWKLAHNETTAAWTDPARFSTSATTGHWATQRPAAESVFEPQGDTAVAGADWEFKNFDSNLGFCVTLKVTGNSPEPRPWEVRADLREPPFNGMTGTGSLYSTDGSVLLSTAAGDDSTLIVRGRNNETLGLGESRDVVICVSVAGIPTPGKESWYEVTSARSGEWTPTQACVRVTAKGLVKNLADNPFYFGWKHDLDLTEAKAHIVEEGKTLNYVGWNPYPSQGHQFTATPSDSSGVPDGYAITSGRMTALRGTESVSFEACVYGY